MRKSWVIFLLFVVSFFVIISCGKNGATGLVGAGKVKLTETPTPTPDVNFTVYIHQEDTPVVDVLLTLKSIDTGLTVTAKTGADGVAGFEVHNGGQWTLTVDTFNGFKYQNFTVEPLSNTYYAVNYGIPSLDLELVSGSEMIPIQPSTLVYKLTYHTMFEREEMVKINNLNIPNVIFSPSSTVKQEGDSITCTLNIPRSFELYDDSAELRFNALCEDLNGENTISNERTLTKNWLFNITVDFHYMQVYAYDDNNRRISYYAGIKSFSAGNSYNIPFNGNINCEAIGAKNIGVDGEGTTVNAGLCTPSYTGFGCFQAMMKIRTGATLYNNNLRDDNSGEVTVRFYDSGYLDVIRTFRTESDWQWGIACSWWCCTSAPSNGVSRVYEYCKQGLVAPFGICLYPWDQPVTADIKRKKSGSVNITK